MSPQSTLQALLSSGLLPALQERGYRVVTVSELLEMAESGAGVPDAAALALEDINPPNPHLFKEDRWHDHFARLRAAVVRTEVLGVATNLAVLRSVLEHEDFADGGVDTAFLDRHPELMGADSLGADESRALAAVGEVLSVEEEMEFLRKQRQSWNG